MSDLVTRHDRDGAATLTLNRPDKLNALNVELFVELNAHVQRLAQETETVGLVILRGAGRCFSAGHDLGDIAAGEKLPEPQFQSKVIERLADLPQPVITAVHGHCYTGALELALAGDIIFAAEGAKFADTHAKWALTPVWGLSQRLPRRVGTYKAREMMLTCRTFFGPTSACRTPSSTCGSTRWLRRSWPIPGSATGQTSACCATPTACRWTRAWRMRCSAARDAGPTWKPASPGSRTRASNRPEPARPAWRSG
jgi:enoyl-CoA hydratase